MGVGPECPSFDAFEVDVVEEAEDGLEEEEGEEQKADDGVVLCELRRSVLAHGIQRKHMGKSLPVGERTWTYHISCDDLEGQSEFNA